MADYPLYIYLPHQKWGNILRRRVDFMGSIHKPLPVNPVREFRLKGLKSKTFSNAVKLIISLFTRKIELITIIEETLSKKFGSIDSSSEILNFNQTQYYQKEFGDNLKRKFISFNKLISPDKLWKIKTITNKLEEKFSKENKRQINLDPGYITQANLILASTKEYSHRIYIKNGIYQEVTLIFKDKTFHPLPWTYPDYQTKEYIDVFIKMRDILNAQLKS